MVLRDVTMELNHVGLGTWGRVRSIVVSISHWSSNTQRSRSLNWCFAQLSRELAKLWVYFAVLLASGCGCTWSQTRLLSFIRSVRINEIQREIIYCTDQSKNLFFMLTWRSAQKTIFAAYSKIIVFAFLTPAFHRFERTCDQLKTTDPGNGLCWTLRIIGKYL